MRWQSEFHFRRPWKLVRPPQWNGGISKESRIKILDACFFLVPGVGRLGRNSERIRQDGIPHEVYTAGSRSGTLAITWVLPDICGICPASSGRHDSENFSEEIKSKDQDV